MQPFDDRNQFQNFKIILRLVLVRLLLLLQHCESMLLLLLSVPHRNRGMDG